MTIRIKITCDRCEFIGYDSSGFYNRHFSRISTDGKDNNEFFHLCRKCQEELSRLIILPDIELKTIALSKYAHNALATPGEIPNLYGMFKIHNGVII